MSIRVAKPSYLTMFFALLCPAVILFSSPLRASPMPPGGEHWRDANTHGWSPLSDVSPAGASSSSSSSFNPAAQYISDTSFHPAHLNDFHQPTNTFPWAISDAAYGTSSRSHQQASENSDFDSMYENLPKWEPQDYSALQHPLTSFGVTHPQRQSQWQGISSSHPSQGPEGAHEGSSTHGIIAYSSSPSIQTHVEAVGLGQEQQRQQQEWQQYPQQWTHADDYGQTEAARTRHADLHLNLDVDNLLKQIEGQQISSSVGGEEEAKKEIEERKREWRKEQRRRRVLEHRRSKRLETVRANDPARAERLEATASRREWKAHLKRGSLKLAYDNYYKYKDIKETTARKHFDFVQSIPLLEQLMSTDEVVAKEAATRIFELNDILNHTNTMTEGKRLLNKSYGRVVSDFAGVVDKSISTVVRRLETTLTPEMAELLQNDETYEEGFQALKEAYENGVQRQPRQISKYQRAKHWYYLHPESEE